MNQVDKAIPEVGGFDLTAGSPCEELDLQREAGYKLCRVEEPTPCGRTMLHDTPCSFLQTRGYQKLASLVEFYVTLGSLDPKTFYYLDTCFH